MGSSWLDRITEVNERRVAEAGRPARGQDRGADCAHQIKILVRDHQIGVTCTCCKVPRRGRPGYTDIEVRRLFPAGEAIAAWRGWHERQDITV